MAHASRTGGCATLSNPTKMISQSISSRVEYIGVNDRTTPRFEGLWPLPSGVSYNSYLVRGKTAAAIIDGVEVSRAGEQIEHIRQILGDTAPAYLVINHMEPDHSGGISALCQAFPELVIVGNKITLEMVRGFYGEPRHCHEIKDGDSIDLGEAHLRFVLTPMVHWPETMMTILEEEKMAFSGDAFGCFGALNGAVLDSQMDTAPYFPEMVRYYSNIVGKYGTFVLKAIEKVKPYDIRTICPTHGPVWQQELSRVLEIYSKLAAYEPLDEGATIVYGSMYGNSERLAEAAAEGLAEAGVKKIQVLNASFASLSELIAAAFTHRILIIAAPTYSNDLFPPVASFIQAISSRGLENRRVGLIGSHTWAPAALRIMTEMMTKAKLTPAAEPFTVKQTPDADKLTQARTLAHTLATQNCQE